LKNGGKRRTIWVPLEMDTLIENTRKKLGLNRSSFFKYAATKLLQELDVLTEELKAETFKKVEVPT
jgi:hypothetical protein